MLGDLLPPLIGQCKSPGR